MPLMTWATHVLQWSFNASAATVLAFGAKSIEMHEDGMWLAHKCSLGVDIWGQLQSLFNL